MPPPSSTSTKPRVEWGELRRTQTMSSAISRLPCAHWRCWAVLCCEGSLLRGPPWCSLLAKRSSDQSLPLLVCHTRYPTKMMMMIMRSVCVVVKTSEEVVVIETNIVECADMKLKCQNKKWKQKVKSWCFFFITWKGNPSIFCHFLTKKSFVWRFLKIFFAGDNSYKVVRIRGNIPNFQWSLLLHHRVQPSNLSELLR